MMTILGDGLEAAAPRGGRRQKLRAGVPLRGGLQRRLLLLTGYDILY